MSQLSSLNVPCETIQFNIEEQFAVATTPLDQMPLLLSILETQRGLGITQSVSDGNGKVRTVNVKYEQRLPESAATDTSGARTCTATAQTYDAYTAYDIDPTSHVTANEKFTLAELAKVCEPVESFLAKKINKVIDVIERKVATKTAYAAVALTGKWGSNVSVNGSDELVLPTFISAAAKTIDYTAMTTLEQALMNTGYSVPPIIVGGSTFWAYGRHIQAGCCSTTGVDVLQMANEFGQAILYDKRVATALGSEAKTLVYQPGSLALITYNEFALGDSMVGANYKKMTVFSPRTGLPIDIILKDDCGTIHIVGYAVVELVGLPSDLFAVGDEYRGVKYVNKILVTNPA
jgi:hypothetical protein